MASLTGDSITDDLIPVAQQLIGAVRANNPAEVDEALAAAILVTKGRCDPGAALAVVCAAMVPDDAQPSTLLLWWKYQIEYDRLIAAGTSPQIARQLAAVGDAEKESAA